jgi:hypothetical protein
VTVGTVSNEVGEEAEEFPLLDAVTRERPVKTHQPEKTVFAVVICKVWK